MPDFPALKQKIISGQPVNGYAFCRLMLPRVSRTFALNILALGFQVRKPVLLGYLFCRIADTIEDNGTFSPAEKSRLLQVYNDLFAREGRDDALLNEFKQAVVVLDPESNDEFLTQHLEIVFGIYHRLPGPVRIILAKSVMEMIQGMKNTVETQAGRPALGTENQDELERYCYYVAGTVGNMLTDLFAYYSPWIGKKRYLKLCQAKEAFGAGLQLTNIIKDMMDDLQRGVSFIPRDLAAEHGLPDLAGIGLPENRPKARQVMNALILKATQKLSHALRYTLLIPRLEPRMRLFCLWPLFFAIRTLRTALRSDNLFDPANPVKITRREVKDTMFSTTAMVFSNRMLVWEYRKFQKHVEESFGVIIPLEL
jgi:farnesyl-diphosphate farnesyltransferase